MAEHAFEQSRCGHKAFTIDYLLQKQKKQHRGKNSDGESSSSPTPPSSPSLRGPSQSAVQPLPVVTFPPAHYGTPHQPSAVLVPAHALQLLHRAAISYPFSIVPAPAPQFYPRPLYARMPHTEADQTAVRRDIGRLPSTSDADDSEEDSSPETQQNASETEPSGETNENRRDGFRKKKRTAFTTKQLQELESKFDDQKYLTKADRTRLAKRLGLTEKHVKTWYQNRRTKWKRGATEIEWSREREISATVMYQQFISQKNGMETIPHVIPL